MRTLFIGGPGRSGTSLVARRIGTHPEVAALPDIELKIFTEKNGLLDLHHSLVTHYSPNRAAVAVAQFRRLADDLIEGRLGQPALGTLGSEEVWRTTFAAFIDQMLVDGHPVRQNTRQFFARTRALLAGLGETARDSVAEKPAARLFLEKTPHALLEMTFLEQIDPKAGFLHVMRDPRAIAWSLRRMRWAPDSIAACCTWVESYCRAWVDVRAQARERRTPVLDLCIEAVAADPKGLAQDVTHALGIADLPTLFLGTNPDALRVRDCDRAARAELDRRLAAWAERFGYRTADIGVLRASEELCVPGQ